MRSTVFILSLVLSACISSAVHDASTGSEALQPQVPSVEELSYEVYLIGDAGGSNGEGSEPAIRLLDSLSSRAVSDGVIVFLGDNAYCCGLPDSADARRAQAEFRLMEQIKAVRDYHGKVVFIPGNHDWGHGGIVGPEILARQESFIEEQFDGENVFLPDNGLPGPVEVKLKDDLSLIVLDTEWWMTDSEKPYGDSGEAEIEEEGDLILGLQDLVSRRKNEDLIVVGHHPIRSNGRHGGHYSIKDHLFPLTAVFDNAWLPLPIIGSLYPLLRNAVGGPQDFSNWKYASFRRALDSIFRSHEGRLVYASGHEHSLQYFAEDNIFHVISGGGSRPEYVASGHGADFTSGGEGLIRLRLYESGELWIEAWGFSESEPDGTVLFSSQMSGPKSRELEEESLVNEVPGDLIPEGSTETTAVNSTLKAGALQRFFMGDHHREAWTRGVTAPVLDIGTVHGGLTPVKRGGGLQTTSIRLQSPEGHQYVLRSINKDPTKTIPENLAGTVAADVVKDQIAILHPFGALIVPSLADAAGIYHTNPKLFYVPRDPRFGPFEELVAEQMMLLEERPDNDMSYFPSFGRSKDVVSASKMYREIADDNDNRVDEHFFARSRLFDMLISDWDRHADQWRWAAFPAQDYDGTIFRAIPRDRDWAFNRMNGLLPSLIKSKYVMPKFQDFGSGYGYLPGLNQNGMVQDRRFTASLEREDWKEIASDLRQSLNDNVIETAVKSLPSEVVDIYETEYSYLLKERRDKIVEVAEDYYELLAKLVDVVGSNKHERFEIRRIDDERTLVIVYKITKTGTVRRELYRRVFLKPETDEIRLYGLGGDDIFVLNGHAQTGIRIYAVGGTGSDHFEDQSDVQSQGKYFTIHDIPEETRITQGPDTRLRLSPDPLVNEYDPYDFWLSSAMPRLFIGRNQDDGYFLGGGATFVTGGFRQKPFDSQQTILANVAAKTGAFNVVYEGIFAERFGSWDFGIGLYARTPNNIRNFFGLGNRTENTEDESEFYQARMSQLGGGIRWIRNLTSFAELYLGPTVEYTDIRRDEDRFIAQAGVATSSFEDHWYAGFEGGLIVDARDSAVYPRQGFMWRNQAHIRIGLQGVSTDFTQLTSNFAMYLTPPALRRHTIAARIGVEHNMGEFPFYLASTIGGASNLRGWRSTRFAGRTALFQNIELRSSILTFATLLAAGSAGTTIFVDNGRVWTDGEKTSQWHQGFGGGLWINFFDMSVFTGTMGVSKEEATLTLKLGFFY